MIRGAYDRKCDQLKREFSRGLNARVIDRTRAVAKDLHSQVRVAIHAVNSISKRIEKLRDEELQLQLLELVNGWVIPEVFLAFVSSPFTPISEIIHHRILFLNYFFNFMPHKSVPCFRLFLC